MKVKIVKVTAKNFVAFFTSRDGIITSADQYLDFLLNWPDAKVRGTIKKNGWQAIVVETRDEQVGPSYGSVKARGEPQGELLKHSCEVCGEAAAFGYGFSLLKGLPGKWYCREHRPQ